MSATVALLAIGGGPAALAAARAYRAAGGRGAVALVAEEGTVPYQRPPLSKELLRGEGDERELPLESRGVAAQARDRVGGDAGVGARS